MDLIVAQSKKRDYLLNWCKNCVKGAPIEITDFSTRYCNLITLQRLLITAMQLCGRSCIFLYFKRNGSGHRRLEHVRRKYLIDLI
jgi:hypothetical protein